MKNHITELGKHIELTHEEYSRMQSKIFAHVRAVPQEVRKSPFGTVKDVSVKKIVAGTLMLLMAISSAQITRAAQFSFPGETLYGVKRVSEQMHTAVTFSDVKQVRLAGEHAVRRLHERAVLQKEGTLTPEIINDLSGSLQKQVVIIEQHIDSDHHGEESLTETARALARVAGYANTIEVSGSSDDEEIIGAFFNVNVTDDSVVGVAQDFVASQEFLVASQLETLSGDSLTKIVADETANIVIHADTQEDAVTAAVVEAFSTSEIQLGEPLDAPLETLGALTDIAEVEALGDVIRSLHLRENSKSE